MIFLISSIVAGAMLESLALLEGYSLDSMFLGTQFLKACLMFAPLYEKNLENSSASCADEKPVGSGDASLLPKSLLVTLKSAGVSISSEGWGGMMLPNWRDSNSRTSRGGRARVLSNSFDMLQNTP